MYIYIYIQICIWIIYKHIYIYIHIIYISNQNSLGPFPNRYSRMVISSPWKSCQVHPFGGPPACCGRTGWKNPVLTSAWSRRGDTQKFRAVYGVAVRGGPGILECVWGETCNPLQSQQWICDNQLQWMDFVYFTIGPWTGPPFWVGNPLKLDSLTMLDFRRTKT